MGLSVRMRRIDPSGVDEGLDALEAGFEATLDDSVYDEECAAGILCDLAEEWRAVEMTFRGRGSGYGPISDVPVMGGTLLGHVDTPPDAIVLLPQDGVRAAADFLAEIDVPRLIEANREELTRQNAGSLPDWVIEGIIRDTENLKRFYGLAAAAGQVVVKRIYTD
ncbi:DUF1877 family protein [Streptomyces viridochromogenes]|nr:DUF1877 family protein [Streptomyces viridochromogenes]